MADEKIFFRDRKIMNGIKGMFPLSCLPLRGRVGVTLIAFLKEWSMTGFL